MKKFIQYDGWRKTYRFLNFHLALKFKPFDVDCVNLDFDEISGLGNRLFGIVNIINYLKPKVVNFYWDKEHWVIESFNNLFNFNSSMELNEYNNRDEFLEMCRQNKSLVLPRPPVELKTRKGKVISFEYNNISKSDKAEFLKYFDNIELKDIIIDRANEIVLPENCVALQIRNNYDWNNYGRNENIELFFNEIEKYSSDISFYISVMNSDVSNVLKTRYKDRIIELPNKDYSSMYDALADLYLMSKCKEAIYSYGSTFCELAWWLGGANQKVILVGNEEGWL